MKDGSDNGKARLSNGIGRSQPAKRDSAFVQEGNICYILGTERKTICQIKNTMRIQNGLFPKFKCH